MAETGSNNPPPEPEIESKEEEGGLKYLNIVQATASHGASYATKLYSLAKDNSGPLKPGLDTVEGTVKSVIAPVVDKYQDAPANLLKAMDRKVDETVSKVQDMSVPTALAKTVTKNIVQKGPAAVISILSGLSKTGLVGTSKTLLDMSHSAFRNIYSTFGPMAKLFAVCAISHLNQLPVFPQLAKAIGPAASFLSETYNRTVEEAAERGIGIASRLPLIPTERIGNLFG